MSDSNQGSGAQSANSITPEDLLKQVAMPGWRELHLTQINLRNVSARRFAACAIDAWRGSGTSAQSGAVEPPAPNPRSKPAYILTGRAFRDARAAREAEEAAQRASANAQAAALKRRVDPELDKDEMNVLRSMIDTTAGKLAYASTVLSAEIEQSPVWEDEQFTSFHYRTNLLEQVTSIVASVRELLRSQERLGPRPVGALADDDEVMRIYERRVDQHDERLAAITRRVAALMQYRDHVRECEPLLEKRKWLEEHRSVDDSDTYRQAASDELASAELARAAEEVEHRTRAALSYLLDDVRRLSSMP